MAAIVPMAYSLAVRLEELAPGRPDLLGVLLGIGSAATLIVAPLTGVLSDRTRSRWGGVGRSPSPASPSASQRSRCS